MRVQAWPLLGFELSFLLVLACIQSLASPKHYGNFQVSKALSIFLGLKWSWRPQDPGLAFQ